VQWLYATSAGNLVATGTFTAANFSGTNTGDLTIGTANGLSLAGQALSMAAAASGATGTMTFGAQSFGGAKTFDALLTATLGVETNATTGYVAAPIFQSFFGAGTRLQASNGAGASDVCVKAGTSQDDESVSAGAKLLSVRTGLGGGAEVEAFYVRSEAAGFSGKVMVAGELVVNTISGANWNGHYAADQMSISAGWLLGSGTSALTVQHGTPWIGGAEDVSYLLRLQNGPTLATDTRFLVTGAGAIVVDGVASLRSATLGAGASDVCVKVGTTVADASVNAAAKLFSVRTGIGATEVERVYVAKGAPFSGILTIDGGGVSNFGHINLLNSGAGATGLVFQGGFEAGGCDIGLGSQYSLGLSYRTNNQTQSWVVHGDAYAEGATSIFSWKGGGSASLRGKDLTRFTADATHTANLARWFVGTDAMAALSALGRIDQSGTDSSDTPGPATINKPTGISAIASGASSVVITNSLATTTCRPIITWLGDHGAARSWVTRATGSLTINISSNASADTAFSWQLSELL
jgi:hypothetical protein